MSRFYRLSVLLALFLLAVTEATAGSTGKISGVVRDARTKEPLPGVNVLVEGTTLGAATDIEGRYVILNVPPGKQRVIASLVGYKRFEARGVDVAVDFTTPLNIDLVQGSVELDAIVVQAERSPLIRQDLTNPVASISSESIQALPVVEISEIIGLQAGVTVGDDGTIHIRGGLGNEISYTLNGININNPYSNTRSVGIATNAVQEVSVSSGTFSAEYGSALSGVVNYVTRDGGPTFTGSLRYLTGDYLSSRSDLFFDIQRYNPSAVNRIEATLGGPIVSDKLTFFGSGVYTYDQGWLFGQRIYLPTDSYLSREGFPTGDPRAGSATDPYYFGPAAHDTSDHTGLPGGDGGVVPLNWARGYKLQGNLSYRILPEMKLKVESVFSFDESPDNNQDSPFEHRFMPDGGNIARSHGWVNSLEFTHTVSSKLFYTLKGSYIYDLGTSWAYDTPDDPRYLPSFYLRSLPNTSYLVGGVDAYRFWRKSEMAAAKFDLVSQILPTHEVKFGLEARFNNLRIESYTLQFEDPNDPNAAPSFSNMLINGNVFKPYVPTPDGGYVSYNRKPVQLAAYLQDKIELFTSIILNMGLRYEYFNPRAEYNPDISSELLLQQSIFIDKNLLDASAKNMLSPRVSVSYPITDQGTIRFSYGHFYQIGSLASLYTNPNFRAPLGTTPTFGNPDVKPQKSVQYELGLQQGLSENLKVEITGYYKDVRDYIFSQQVITPRGDKSYYLLTNLSYANTRGVSISLLKRRASAEDPLQLSLDYTFQVAEGNRTLPTDEIFFNEQAGRLSETYLVPFSFDRSHTLTGTASLGKPDDWLISTIGYFRTGTPYTPSFPSSVVPITFVQNSDRQPVQWNVDLKIEKFFKLGPMEYSVFLFVDNVFDTQNEIAVYANSGRALYNIEETINPTLFSDLRNRIVRGDPGMVPLSAIDNYYANPANVSRPRLFRFGVSMLF
jgi:outer membrane receptor protein involved in Fe transport